MIKMSGKYFVLLSFVPLLSIGMSHNSYRQLSKEEKTILLKLGSIYDVSGNVSNDDFNQYARNVYDAFKIKYPNTDVPLSQVKTFLKSNYNDTRPWTQEDDCCLLGKYMALGCAWAEIGKQMSRSPAFIKNRLKLLLSRYNLVVQSDVLEYVSEDIKNFPNSFE